MRNYKNIKAYQLADEVVLEVYKVTNNFPKQEMFGLTSQIRRAAVSVPANIVEGSSRQHNREYLNFLYISKASLAELEYLLELSHKLNYMQNDIFEKITENIKVVHKTLYGLINSVSKELK